AEMRELLLVGAVVIHLPNFFGAAASADEVDLAFCNTLDASTETEDDFVGEAVGDETRVVFGRCLAVLLSEYLRRLDILYVVEPALYRQRSTLHTGVAEGEHVGVGRRGFPLGELHVLRHAGSRQRVEAG